MSIALIDYGCHSFTYRLASTLSGRGVPVDYIVNASLQSPNLSSLATWVAASPDMVRSISCARPYGKMSLIRRLQGEWEWGRRCVASLENGPKPRAVVASCVPLVALTPIHRWAFRRHVPFVYWLQDIQSRAMHDLLGRKFGMAGRTLGAFAQIWEQDLLEKSDMVITIAPGHEKELPRSVRLEGRHALLQNWANIEEFAQYPVDNDWSRRHGLNRTTNIMYSGTLGMKHDLATFTELALRFQSREDIRVVIVSSDQAAQRIHEKALSLGLSNLVVLPFQPYAEVPQVLASAAVLIAPLDASAGAFCVPSKILSYLCAGRPTVIAIEDSNAAAQTIRNAHAGQVVLPGRPGAFIASVETFLDDRDLRLAVGRAARSYAEATFGMDNILQRFVSILARVNPSFALPPIAQPAVAS